MPSAFSVSKAYSISFSVASMSSIDSVANRPKRPGWSRIISAAYSLQARAIRPASAGADVEPHAGGGGDRQHAGADAALVHVLDHLVAGPGDLAGEVRLLVRVFVTEPELLIFGRIKMHDGYRSAPALSVRALRWSGPPKPRQGRRARRGSRVVTTKGHNRYSRSDARAISNSSCSPCAPPLRFQRTKGHRAR